MSKWTPTVVDRCVLLFALQFTAATSQTARTALVRRAAKDKFVRAAAAAHMSQALFLLFAVQIGTAGIFPSHIEPVIVMPDTPQTPHIKYIFYNQSSYSRSIYTYICNCDCSARSFCSCRFSSVSLSTNSSTTRRSHDEFQP